MEELRPGTQFAGHRIEDVVGRGGMGIVYRAVDLDLEREVALKLIAPQLAGDEAFRARFRREWRLAASIRHPHVVTIYHAGDEGGQLYVTMDYIAGTDLRAMIDRDGVVDPRVATGIIEQIAGALDAAHAAGLVHRDVKPANVLISVDGGFADAYLTDFGLSKQLRGGTAALTQTGMFVGTVDYVAPEQLKGEPVDARSDIYSLGCVLFEAVTGSIPFPRDSETAKMWAHASEPPPSARERRPDLSPELDAVLQRAMAKDPADRFPSAGDLGRAAVAAAAGRAAPTVEQSVATGDAAPDTAVTGAPPPPPPTRIGTPTPPPPPPPVAATPAAPPPPPTAKAQRPTPPNRRPLLIALAGGAAFLVVAGIVIALVASGGSDGGTTTPTAPPKPKANTALAASYRAAIDTGGTLSLQLNANRTALVHLAINMPLSCADGTDDTFRTTFLSATDTQAVDPDGSFEFSGTASKDSFISGGKVTVDGRLEPAGAGTGTARMVEDSRQHGRCDSSIGRWTAAA